MIEPALVVCNFYEGKRQAYRFSCKGVWKVAGFEHCEINLYSFVFSSTCALIQDWEVGRHFKEIIVTVTCSKV